ncbi:hypothetical protein Bbelb_344010 [Branchiostoma belcheri]|nr:hypothetical protein Bbelb_344010 [Branchiostoma belcheri]
MSGHVTNPSYFISFVKRGDREKVAGLAYNPSRDVMGGPRLANGHRCRKHWRVKRYVGRYEDEPPGRASVPPTCSVRTLTKKMPRKENTDKKMRYRANQRNDPARLEAAREKDRERKRKAREEKKTILQGHPRLLMEHREKQKLRMRQYRLKKQATNKAEKKFLEKKGVLLTPEARKSLEVGQGVVESLKEQLCAVKSKGTASPSKRRAYDDLRSVVNKSKSPTALRKKLLIRKTKMKQQDKQWWRPKVRKQRKDIIPEQVKQKVREFYLSPEISREVPDKRAAVKIKEGSKVTLVQRHTMTMTLEEAFGIFKKMYPEDKLALTSFSKLRPLQVKKASETSRRTCLCQVCCNPALKTEALKAFIVKECPEHRPIVLPSKQHVINVTLCHCEYETKHPRASCLKRTCRSCGTQNLEQHYKAVMEGREDSVITWNTWEYINISTTPDKGKRVVSGVTKNTSLREFTEEYKKNLEGLPSHVFRANWQHDQLKVCIETPKKEEACICMDYAESYTCRFQQEVQSAFFDQNQTEAAQRLKHFLAHERSTQLKTTGNHLQLAARNISCYCPSCNDVTASTACSNKEYVEEWSPAQIQLTTSQPTLSTIQEPDVENEEVPSTSTEVNNSIKKGDFVAVKLTSKRKACNIYMAEVMEYEEGDEELHLSFMKKTGEVYVWPDKKDTTWEATENVICTVGFPVLTNFRQQFRFSKEDIETVKYTVQ